MPDWLVWALIGGGALALLVLYFLLGSGPRGDGRPINRDRWTNEALSQAQSDASRTFGSNGL